jgi:hypothetical protein
VLLVGLVSIFCVKERVKEREREGKKERKSDSSALCSDS